MKRLLLSLLVFISFYSFSVAQDAAQIINKVKRDTTYIYAEATMKERDEALLGAKSILEMKVGEWVRSQHPADGIEMCIAKAKEHTYEVQTLRGDYHRAFVYVYKGDIMHISEKNEIVVFQVPAADIVKPHAMAEEVISEEAPAELKLPVIQLSDDEKEMANITSFYEIEPYVKRLREANRLEAYGKYATMPDTDVFHLFVYDRQGIVKAVIRNCYSVGEKLQSSTQLNLKTLKEDNIKNYKECGAIWVKIKK